MRINSFTPPGTLTGDRIELSPDESHHLARVLRVESGQEMTLFDGEGLRAEGVIKEVSKKAVTVQITDRETIPPPAVDITLIQAIPKPDRFEMVLQKATELGVRTIQPVLSTHTVHRSKDPDKQTKRWQSIILNAAQQCGTAWLPQLLQPVKMNAVIPKIKETDLAFIGSLYENARPFRDTFRDIDRSAVRSVALLIGPEGDFTAEEVRGCVEAGAVPVTFGTQILRTETASIFGLSVLVYELF